jgi:hypothetical protein
VEPSGTDLGLAWYSGRRDIVEILGPDFLSWVFPLKVDDTAFPCQRGAIMSDCRWIVGVGSVWVVLVAEVRACYGWPFEQDSP